jgi:Flp pilus assembly protein TadD
MPGYSIIWTIAGTILLAVLIFLIVKYKPSRKVLWTGSALSLALLLPSLAYEPSFAGVAYDYLDHRTWLPFVGVWLIILGIAEKIKIEASRTAPIIFISVLLVWSGVNVWRSTVYKDWPQYYGNAIDTNPGSGLANLNYGSLLRDEGNWQAALPYIEKGVALSPDYVDAKVRLAEAYYNLKRFDDAIIVSSAALEKEPANVAALQFRGSAYGASGKTEAAAMDFKKILEADPDNLHGIFNLGVAYKDANMLNEAIETFSKLINLKPDFPNAYFERGFCYGKMGLFAQAFRDLETSIQQQPNHGPSYFFRGRSFEAMGDINSACADWQKANQLGTTDAQAYIETKCR